MLTVDILDDFSNDLNQFCNTIKSNKSDQINSKTIRNEGKTIVQKYFRETRPLIVPKIIPETDVKELDNNIQKVLELSNRRTKKSIYKKHLKTALALIQDISIKRDRFLGDKSRNENNKTFEISKTEKDILETLEKLIPSAALSYKQAIFDLSDDNRISFRGVSAELRETLREILDHLAPDEEVIKQTGFSFEKDFRKPTMRQKAHFILRSRGLHENASKVPENIVDLIETLISSIARSFYERSSIASHISTTKSEALQLKRYIDPILAEFLSLY